MRKLVLSIERLVSQHRSIASRMDLLEIANRRIIRKEIILIVLLLVNILISTIFLYLSVYPKGYFFLFNKPEKNSLLPKQENKEKIRFEKPSGGIFQIIRPVRMFFVGSPGVPTPEPFFFSSHPIPLDLRRVGGPPVFSRRVCVFLEGTGSGPLRGNLLVLKIGFGEVIFDYPSSRICFPFHESVRPMDPKGASNSPGDEFLKRNCHSGAYCVAPAFRERTIGIGSRQEGLVHLNVMTPEPLLTDFWISREGTDPKSPRIGTTPERTLGPSLFSKGIEKGGETDEKISTEHRTPGIPT